MTLDPRHAAHQAALERRARMEGRQPPPSPSPGSLEALKAEIRAEVMAEVDAKLRGFAAQIANLYAERDAINIRQERDSARIDGLLVSKAKEDEKRAAREEEVPEIFSVPFSEIVAGVTEFFDVDVVDLFSKQQRHKLARARRIFVVLALRLTPMTLTEIGRHMGGRDRSTIISARDNGLKLLKTDPAFAAELDSIAQLINSNIENSEGDA